MKRQIDYLMEVVNIEGVVISMNLTKKDSSFEQEFKIYYPVVVKKIISILGDAEISKDIAQETFLKYYYQDKKEIDNIKAWLLTVASNLAYNYIRAEQSRKMREEKVILEKNK
ncbi:Sigma-70 region 2 [Desulfonispora thiosulfatigenes DSM 11270]|uniref:Sigma-70 region 2 n=1 Tax=Desulfonispora thiosulfatigenes DSM 11270 TaxID=656914 RepID=A0A1W1V1L5_DESTI|nr:sigma factor [Desulfonispora thiosulfatigenes]SMB87176.1 Sigma-70 region 2 [Desulfonispora thiosulfatigenes DSM 11270]